MSAKSARNIIRKTFNVVTSLHRSLQLYSKPNWLRREFEVKRRGQGLLLLLHSRLRSTFKTTVRKLKKKSPMTKANPYNASAKVCKHRSLEFFLSSIQYCLIGPPLHHYRYSSATPRQHIAANLFPLSSPTPR